MTDTTPRSALPLLAAAQAQKHVTHNDALLQLDALLFARFLSRNVSAPPSTPANGDTYLVKTTGTGAWTGKNGQIAYCVNSVWNFAAPFAGLTAYVADESKLVVFNGTAWVDYASLLVLQNVPQLGVNATADATNKFSVASSAILFNNIGNGVQAKLNKNAATDTGSILYQSGFSGRAEIGLTGDDDFHFKVSGDGSTWFEALKIARANGLLTLPVGQLAFPATQNPSSNANTLDDYREGTFTPVVAGMTTAGTNSYSTQVGNYTKIGNKVFFQLSVVMTAKDAAMSGGVKITGLPFTSNSTPSLYSMVPLVPNNVTFGTTRPMLLADIPAGSNFIQCVQAGNGVGNALMDSSALASNSELYVTGHYVV